jgi:ankyrin repeat protein
MRLLLAENGVDPDLRDSSDRTSLLWAAGSGHNEVMKLLFTTERVDPDSKETDD